MKSSKIKVLIVDDHHVVRAGIVALLNNQPDIQVVGEAEDGLDAIEKVRALSPNIVLMDISMPNMNGIEATYRIKKHHAGVNVLVLTQYENEEYIKRVLQCGASGYILKNSLTGDLLKAIRTVHSGEQFFTPAISKIIIDSFVKQSNIPDYKVKEIELTPREREILQLIAEGNTNQQIADKLFISVRTVEFHRANIIEKLGVHDVAGLVKYAIQKGLVRVEY
ncbi:MAG: response regulator transcription factor [Ignavibacteriae bacterium]|nr:response regulator transcription factor [Ignavibacteriota bacterium]